MAIIKFESMSKGQKKMIKLEILGWVIFRFFLIFFIVPIIKVIKKILRYTIGRPIDTASRTRLLRNQ